MLRRLVCSLRGHCWLYASFGLQRKCSRCLAIELADLLRGGWYRVPARFK